MKPHDRPARFFVFLVLSGVGCSDPSLSPGRIEVITAGDTKLEVDAGKNTLSLRRNETTLLYLPISGIALGSVAEVSNDINYDPYRLHVPSPLYTQPEVTWHAADTMTIDNVTATSIDVTLGFSDSYQGTLRLETEGLGSFKAALLPGQERIGTVAYMRISPHADAEEAFYGLGEAFDDVNNRGKVRAMHIVYEPGIESGYNEAHVPIPFVIGTRGWGLFVESQYPGAFALGTTAPDIVEAAFGTGIGSKDGLLFHLFADAHPLDVTRHYYEITGFPRLPARWALGPWVWRDENINQAQVENDLNTMRALDLPTTGIWIDLPYESAVGAFDFDPSRYPSAQGLVDLAHHLGFRLALWHVPYVDSKAPTYADVASRQFFTNPSGLKLNDWGLPIDFTNAEATTYWQEHLKYFTNLGVEGFKLDYGEDIVPGLTAARNVWGFSDGSDERTMHAGYQLLYHRVYDELMPDTGGFLLCRSGAYGDQKHVGVIWPGDLDASFAKNHEQVNENGEKYTAVGGLPASIIAGLSLGPSGFPFYGADTGGYRHSPPDKELLTRWFEQTALSTVMQIGNSADTVAWEPDPNTGVDAEMLGWYRTYTRLHLRLFPYEWTYAKKLAENGRPIARALGLAFPELGVHPSDTYLFGDSLLVAPVVERGATERSVVFPPGKWVDYWNGEIIDGGGSQRVSAPLDTLPLYIPEGGIVTMLRPTIDTIAPTMAPALVDSYATTPGLLYARIVPGAASTFSLFDGAEVTQELAGALISLSWKGGSEFTSGAVFEVIAIGKKPVSVVSGAMALVEVADAAAFESAAAGWYFDQAVGGTVWIKAGSGDASVQIVRP